jgi:hypothetical protein
MRTLAPDCPRRSQSPGLAVPHPCQNARAQRVIGGHSGDMRRRGDLDSGCYQCGSNKPDKDVVILRPKLQDRPA